MKKILFLLNIIMCLFTADTLAQTESVCKTAIGVRINNGVGISALHNMNDDQSWEAILYYRWHGLNLTGLYQINYPMFNDPDLRFYMGVGAHAGMWDGEYDPKWEKNNSRNYFIAGIDGQAGVEYSFKNFPLNLSIDWKPGFNFIDRSHFWVDDIALSIRYKIK